MKPKKNLKLLVALAESGMRQKDLAKKAEVSRAVISMTINGRYIPSADHMEKIARALNSSTGELFGLDNRKNK